MDNSEMAAPGRWSGNDLPAWAKGVLASGGVDPDDVYSFELHADNRAAITLCEPAKVVTITVTKD